MTCIIGARGKDGVVIVSDRRIARGNEIYDEDKIHIFWEGNPIVAIGFAGYTGIRDKFCPAVSAGMAQARVGSLAEVINGVENTISTLNERYSPRIGKGGLMSAFVAGLAGLNSGKAEIHHLYEEGYAEQVHSFDCIGSAGAHAASFLKLVFDENMSLEDLVGVGGFIITLIEGMGIDRNVGGGVDAIKIMDEGGIEQVENSEMLKLLEGVSADDAFKSVSSLFKKVVSSKLTLGEES